MFGALGATATAREMKAYYTWPRVTAQVDDIKISPVGTNPYASITLKLDYPSESGVRSVWAYKYFLPGRGAKFAGTCAVGTKHLVWIDPATPQRAEIELGLNLETLLVPLVFWGVAACLLFTARYFWRSRLWRNIEPGPQGN